jgi:putative hydrolase of the HAD superfamily
VAGRYDAVFFDVGNTLLYPYPSVGHVCEEILRASGRIHALDEIEDHLVLVDEYYEDRYRTDDTFWTNDERVADVWNGMYLLLCRKLGIPELQAAPLARAVYDAFGEVGRWRAYDDVMPAFRRLREKGFQVGIISNWDARLEGILAGLGIGGLVDTVISSAVVGIQKPDPRIFELACARLGADPARCAHVGDHYYADVVGARAVGMLPVLIDRHDAGLAADGVACLTTLDDLEEALR